MRIRFYQTRRGERPVEQYIEDLPVVERAKVAAAISDIAQNGLVGSSASFRQIEHKLWEIKISAQRIFYVVMTGPEMILLHAYKKQSQKAPEKELSTARRRLKEIIGEQ